MNETQKNTRTLIVSFVVALMALIPLRMVEAGGEGYSPFYGGNTVVLGESVDETAVATEMEDRGVQEVSQDLPVFESAYRELESSDCLETGEVERRIGILVEEIDSGVLNKSQVENNFKLMQRLEELRCAR